MAELEEFYTETDPFKRQEIFEKLDLAASPLHVQLWENRYGKRRPKNDAFVGFLMELKYIAESGGTDIGGGKRKQAAGVVNGMFLYQYENRPVDEQQIISNELKNVIKRYIFVSKRGRGFTSVLFGMGELSEESVVKKMGEQLGMIAFKAPHMVHMDKEFAPLQNAVLEVFREQFPNREHLIAR